MNIEYLKDKLKNKVSEKRYNHSLEVLKTAIELGEIYNYPNMEEIKISAILHDYAKNFEIDELQKLTIKYFPEEKNYIDFLPILHGYVAAGIIQDEFNISNINIINSIKYHTTGRRDITLLEKIIYLADAIEPTRDYPNVDKIRNLAKINLDEAIFLEVNLKIKHLIDTNSLIHPYTIEMRNYLLESRGEISNL